MQLLCIRPMPQSPPDRVVLSSWYVHLKRLRGACLFLRMSVLSRFNSTSVAAGQVISRLKLTVWGNPGTTAEATGAFQKIVAITAGYFLTNFTIFCICLLFPTDGITDDIPPLYIVVLLVIRSTLGYAYLLFLFIVLWNVRSHIRSKYAIPESCNTCCDDLLCAVCCGHCAAAQMLRHTADYDTYMHTCCSETGLPPHVPSIV